MKTRWFYGGLILAFVWVAQGHPAAWAENFSTSTMEMSSVMSRLESLEAELASLHGGQGCVCASDARCCCIPSGCDVGIELTVLKPVGTSLFGESLDWDAELAPRLWFGYSAQNGVGIRGRYWQFDHGTTGSVTGFIGEPDMNGVAVTQGLDLDVMDLEVTNRSPVGCCWDMILAGGFRYVHREMDWSYASDGRFMENITVAGDYGGATVAAELRRPWRGNLALFGTGRGSILAGDTGVSVAFDGQPVQTVEIEDDVFAILETQLGVEWQRPLRGNRLLYARLAGEAQYWDGAFVEEAELSFGFLGVALGLGMLR